MPGSQAVRHPDSESGHRRLKIMFYTYILENIKGRLYIGYANNVNIRLTKHNAGGVVSTRNKGPWKLIFAKEFNTKKEAYTYESYLKSLKNPKYIREKIIAR